MNEPAARSWLSVANLVGASYLAAAIGSIVSGILGNNRILVFAGVSVLAWRAGRILPRVYSRDIWAIFDARAGNRAPVLLAIYAAILTAGLIAVLLGQQMEGVPRFLSYLVGGAVGIFGFAALVRMLFRLLTARTETLVNSLSPQARQACVAGTALVILTGLVWVLYANLA